MKNIKTYTAGDIEKLLRNRYSPPEYAFLPQVRNQTGYSRQIRTADALVMSLYPSRGLYLSGFEIKVNRGDFVNEIKYPDKAEDIAKYCDFWWIAAPKEIVKIEELPINWGLIIPFGQTMKIIKPAIINPEITKIDRVFFAGILRKVQETITPEAELRKAKKEGEEIGSAREKTYCKYQLEELTDLKKCIKEFEDSSGLYFNKWSGTKELGYAVKLVMNGEYLNLKNQLENLLKKSKQISEDIEKNLKEIHE
jgi:hypothetical protein